MIDLEYEPGSLLPPLPEGRLREFEQRLSDYWEKPVRLPAAYAEHVTAFHGGVPGKKCFTMPSARVRAIGRFLNYLEEEDLQPPYEASWRSWTLGPDIRMDYQVDSYFMNEFWNIRLNAEDADLLPIAGLDMNGHDCRAMDEYDLLCLDFTRDGEPPVVAWQFDGSWWETGVITEPVAASFAEFLPMLGYCPPGLPREDAESF